MYLLRLDDASEYIHTDNWKKITNILDKYNIIPIFGIIPNNEDKELTTKYSKEPEFWNLVDNWIYKGWVPALHGYNHVFSSNNCGINPVNYKSEFAGLSYDIQSEKIRKGYDLLTLKRIKAEIFFAPAHTFDENTLLALKNETDIRVISDTIANDIYYENSFYFIPQQSGQVRNLPFKVVTFCYHPNGMCEKDFEILENFLNKYSKKFVRYEKELLKERKIDIKDQVLKKIYFMRK